MGKSRASKEDMVNYGLRPDKTKKGPGYFGELIRPDKKSFSTELSLGVSFDGKKKLIPSLVPTLSKNEITYLLKGKKPTEEIVRKATEFAKGRMRKRKDVFAQEGEQIANYYNQGYIKKKRRGK